MALLVSACWLGGAEGLSAQQPAADEGVKLLKSDSRTPYVHRITLYDHEGAVIDPTDELAGPYSPRATCAKCHDYGAISAGWHFNAPLSTIPPGRPGEPWLLVDPLTGTQLPISGREWPGVFAPEEVGLTNWQLVLRFGRHTPGGGFGEPRDEEVRQSPEAARWAISGKLEIDCMFCHSADFQHDPAEAARQIEAENFKWAPTAALGLAVVRGEARKAPDDWDPLMPPSPDYPEQAGPRLVWNTSQFDPDDRVFFNITRRPPNERCYFCHSFRQIGPDAPPRMSASPDVHLAAGLLCVDCHRHGLDHMMTRGYRAEAAERVDPMLAAYSCEGCHLGAIDPENPEVTLGGRYGAPHPQHRGLPPLHFEKLTCTTCHSGPWPEMNARQFQTAMGHGLGLATREREDDNLPYILEPVFARQPDGRIAPQRMVWPRSQPGQQPYRWSIAHDVRPAAQALGVRGCADCHAAEAPIFFGSTGSKAPPGGTPVMLMYELRGDYSALPAAWGLGFLFRPTFKVLGFTCAVLIVVVLVRHGLHGFRGDGGGRRGFSRYEHGFHFVAIVGVMIQAATGLVVKGIVGELTGWTLLLHAIGAPLFIFGFTGTVLQWASRCRFGGGDAAAGGGLTAGQRLVFWVAAVLGLVTMSAMLAAMLPIFGYADQARLIELHEIAALLLVIVMVLHTVVSLAARRVVGEAKGH